MVVRSSSLGSNNFRSTIFLNILFKLVKLINTTLRLAIIGSTPYPDVPLVDLYRMLSEGYRMERPKNCSPEL